MDGIQGFSLSDADGTRTRNLRIDSPNSSNLKHRKKAGEVATTSNRCTNGCTCQNETDTLTAELLAFWHRLDDGQRRQVLADFRTRFNGGGGRK